MSPAPEIRRIEADAIYTTKEAAALVRLSAKTIQRKIQAGIIRGKGRYYRIRGSELLKLA